MANQDRKNLKIKTLEQQLENKDKRIKHLQKVRNSTTQNKSKQQEPSISDNLLLDLFSFFKLG